MSLDLAPSVEMKILDKRLFDWGLPRYHTIGSAGIDMFACIQDDLVLDPQGPPALIPSGFALLMPNINMAALLLSRSGLGHKKGLVLSQAVGTIDADYTAEIFISAWLRRPPGSEAITIKPGDRIAQLVFVPVIRPDLTVVDNFSSETARSAGGFGSTGVGVARPSRFPAVE